MKPFTRSWCLPFLLVVVPACGDQAPGPRPNVVLISLDTLRADHLSAYGYSRETSPHIDALAAEGILFERVTSQSPKTAPSHMTILTGLFPESHGVRNLDEEDNRRLSPNIPTLASLLKEAGYRTAALTASGHVVAQLGFDQGFDSFVSSGMPGMPGGAYNIFKRARELLGELADSKPFFLFVHTYQTHDPYTPPAEFRKLWIDPEYSGNIIADRERLLEVSGTDWPQLHEAYWERVDSDSEADIDYLKDLYDAGIRYTDAVVGEFLKELELLGLADNTLVILLSDHGEEFQEHGRFMHETVYEEVLRVPLVMRLPASMGRDDLRGTRISRDAGLVDVLPTTLDLLSIPIPSHIQGRSLLEESNAEGDAVVSHWPRARLYSVRKGSWKLVREEGQSDRTELYNLASDPGERHDLAAEEPERCEELLAELRRFQEEKGAMRARFEQGGSVEISNEKRNDLKALGYLNDDDEDE